MSQQRSAPRILVADDQPDVLAALGLLLRSTGFEADPVPSVQAVRDRLTAGSYDLLLMDLNYARDTTSGREGLELLAEIHERDRMLPIIVMTGWASVDTAVEAMRLGARNFVSKPWDNVSLTDAVRREVEEGIARREVEAYALRELEEAQRIQRSLLPASLPVLAGFEMAALWKPASAVGGDCYDVRHVDDHTVAVSIADVAGKGLPAALVMSNLQASLRAYAVEYAPDAIASAVNGTLCERNTDGRFVTLFYGTVDELKRTLQYVNAGHLSPILVRTDGSTERLMNGGVPLGLFADARFAPGEVALRSGDRLLLFTDGITEAEDASRHEFGDARLVATVVEHRAGSPQRIVQAVIEAVRSFSNGALQDDATVICLAVP